MQLGYRYIWIDALRIIQNNKADVEREILQMPYIYKNAELTICASTAKSCSDGFLQVRPEYSEFHMPLILRNGSQGIIYFDSYQFASPPLGEILATRAWAFQERLLSPRLLQYGWRATRWTCACDNGYGGQNGLSLNNAKYNHFLHVSPFGLRLFPRSREELFDGWATLVAKYSNLILSRQEDRLAAIGGLAQELQRITGVRYLAGLWDYEKLPSLLQWNAISTHKLSSRPRPSQAPTWSWAGVNGPVVIHHSEEIVDQFRIIASDVVGGFGTTARGSITMQGPTRTGKWWCKIGNLRIGSEQGAYEAVKTWSETFFIWPDCTDELIHFSDNEIKTLFIELTFIAIGRVNWNHQIVRGLILKRNETQNVFTRVGFFQCPDKEEFAIKTWAIETVVIV